MDFVLDLASVAGTTSQTKPARLSVASFCPAYPKDPIYSDPARAFARLPEQRWFLACLLVTQLAAQASHSSGTRYYFGSPAVLVGLLSSYWNIVHPGFLLLVLGLYREAVEASDTIGGLEAILRYQVDELHNSKELNSKPTLGGMRAALEAGQMPNNLTPFVPYAFPFSPDGSAVQKWHACLCRSFADAAP